MVSPCTMLPLSSSENPSGILRAEQQFAKYTEEVKPMNEIKFKKLSQRLFA